MSDIWNSTDAIASKNENLQCTGCPKKNAWSCFLAITPLWKGVGRKVRGVLKTSGNSPCDRHNNFQNLPFRSWENWVQRWQLNLKNLEKNWEKSIFFLFFYGFPSPVSDGGF